MKYSTGVLVECDPSIKAIINRINDQHNHDFIIEDIDDEHVLIKSQKHDELKQLLKDVRTAAAERSHEPSTRLQELTTLQALKDTVKEADESSESE